MEAVIAKRLWSLKEKPSTLPWKGDKGAFRKRARPYKVPIIGLKMHKRFVFLKKLWYLSSKCSEYIQTGSLFWQCHLCSTLFGSMKDTKVNCLWILCPMFQRTSEVRQYMTGQEFQEKPLRGDWWKLWWWSLGCDKEGTMLEVAESWDICQAWLHTNNGTS